MFASDKAVCPLWADHVLTKVTMTNVTRRRCKLGSAGHSIAVEANNWASPRQGSGSQKVALGYLALSVNGARPVKVEFVT